jgi:glycosyltransferase involved in cell wall biosynthesis
MSNFANNPFSPLVSIIIPCYNHGKYLSQAVESILAQDYKNIEIVVVDDGSADNTKTVAQEYNEVKYVYQTNQGLSAARNTGIDNSTGEFLIFLDADDWLLPEAISKNLKFFCQEERIAFVSGGYQMLNVKQGNVATIKNAVEGDYYHELLKVNYIGMHAAVMFRRSVFKDFRYDTSLRASEDYDLYLRIARKYPVTHHTEPIAMYRKHESNMSGNIPLMLKYTLLVLNRQRKVLKNNKEKRCIEKGVKFWKKYYASELYTQLRTTYQTPETKEESIEMLKKYSRFLYAKYLVAEVINPSKVHLKPVLA